MATAAQPQKLVAHCQESEFKKSLTSFATATNCIILIGPEGDFTPSEIEATMLQGFVPVSLGETRLRTETAALVGVAVLRNGLT